MSSLLHIKQFFYSSGKLLPSLMFNCIFSWTNLFPLNHFKCVCISVWTQAVYRSQLLDLFFCFFPSFSWRRRSKCRLTWQLLLTVFKQCYTFLRQCGWGGRSATRRRLGVHDETLKKTMRPCEILSKADEFNGSVADVFHHHHLSQCLCSMFFFPPCHWFQVSAAFLFFNTFNELLLGRIFSLLKE